MKKEMHLPMNPVIFRDISANVDFVTMSTATSDQKETLDGVEHSVIPVEISSASHPFFTGKGNIIDTTGRVERFKTRMSKRQLSDKG